MFGKGIKLPSSISVSVSSWVVPRLPGVREPTTRTPMRRQT
jgi:hypothetical protein